ncbi:MAG: FAD-dependent 2-octaprenylphenol hydroxylase [Sodalis sp. (in: enterobacteria)]
MQQAFDIVINGAGITGLALACGLQGSGLRVAIIEGHIPEPISLNKQPALRVSAINIASRRFLQYLQVWENIATQCANPFRGIQVWERDSFGRIAFDSSEFGYPELGHIIDNKAIHQGLWYRANQIAEVTLISSTTLRQVVWEKNKVFVTLDNNRILTAKLVVAADGAGSWLRTHAFIPLTFWDYQHHALVALVRTMQPHGNIAHQAFHSDGILAFLPLSDPHLSSIVWSLPPLMAQYRLNISAKTFNAEVAMNFSLTLGLCELKSERKTFPLAVRFARNFAAHRLVLIGDAAHTFHPLAGQGLNLGLMDVVELLGEIQRLQKTDRDIGHYPYLRRYEQNRKQSAALMLASMQGFLELFAGQHPLKKWVRAAGLRLADTLPGVKAHLIKQAIGLNDLPDWLSKLP